MASFDVTGKLIAKYDTVQRTATFRTREFVIEISEEGNGRTFTNFIKFQCVQDRTDILDRFQLNDQVKVTFNLRGSKWEKDGRVNYITNLDAWRIEPAAAMGAQSEPYTDMPPQFVPDKAPEDDGKDDLPF